MKESYSKNKAMLFSCQSVFTTGSNSSSLFNDASAPSGLFSIKRWTPRRNNTILHRFKKADTIGDAFLFTTGI